MPLLVAGAVLAACGSPTASDLTRACPQTYEFGNYGCARIVLIVQEPAKPWPRIRWDARVEPDSVVPGGGASGPPFSYWSEYAPRKVLDVIWQWPPYPQGGDTASAWIVVKMLEDPRPVVVGVPLEVFAADSALRLLHFSPVGTVPRPDTVRLDLRRKP